MKHNWYAYDADYSIRIDADLVVNEHEDPLLCTVTVQDETNAVCIELSPNKVHELRLALQRFERAFG